MRKPLFDGVSDVTNEETLKKMNYFMERSSKLMDLHEEDKRAMVSLARELRDELRTEYRNNDLQRVQKAYKYHELFSRYYKPAISDAYTKTTGQLTQRKAFSLLWDTKSYMRYYMPSKYKD